MRRASVEVMGEEVDMEVEVVAMEATVAEVMVEEVDMVEIMEAAVVEEVEEEEWVDLCHSSRWSRS